MWTEGEPNSWTKDYTLHRKISKTTICLEKVQSYTRDECHKTLKLLLRHVDDRLKEIVRYRRGSKAEGLVLGVHSLGKVWFWTISGTIKTTGNLEKVEKNTEEVHLTDLGNRPKVEYIWCQNMYKWDNLCHTTYKNFYVLKPRIFHDLENDWLPDVLRPIQ